MEQEFRVKRIPPFPSRALVIAAANMLKALGHSGFDALRLEYDLDHTDAGLGSGLMARANSLASYALKDPEQRTPEGIPLQSAIVARAGEIYREGITGNNIGEKERTAFKAASAAAGTLNDVTEAGVDAFVTTPWGEISPVVTAETPAAPEREQEVPPMSRPRKVFVVHGHDDGVREAVARYLERLDFEAIILHEKANRGATLITKFQANSDVGFAVVLLTPDDVGGKTATELQARARQNVLLEWGYFIGRLGQAGVVALRKGDVEIPSDLSGIVWETFDDHGAWRNKLALELEAAGFTIDWKKAAT